MSTISDLFNRNIIADMLRENLENSKYTFIEEYHIVRASTAPMALYTQLASGLNQIPSVPVTLLGFNGTKHHVFRTDRITLSLDNEVLVESPLSDQTIDLVEYNQLLVEVYEEVAQVAGVELESQPRAPRIRA